MAPLLAALLIAPPVRAQEGASAEPPARHEVVFRRAEIRERSLGDFERAADLYLAAAEEAPDAEWRAKAELRAAACLARAGQTEKAKALAAEWTADGVEGVSAAIRNHAREVLATIQREAPAVEPEPVAPAADARRVAILEEERDQARLRLEQSLDQTEGAQKEIATLAAELRAKDREIAGLRERLPPPEPETAEDAMRIRKEQLERQRREAKAISKAWTRYAAYLHQDGRFAEAREFLRDALAQDDENAEAKALLARVDAPLGDREQLYLRIREVLALAREVRKARLTAETLFLVQRGRRLQERGDLTGSVAPLERALALLGSELVAVRGPARVREDVQSMLRRAEAAGATRAPEPTPDPEPLDAGWEQALRGLLARAGAEIEQGLELRFHDLDPLLPASTSLLPPAPLSDPPKGWTLSSRGPDAARLLAAWMAGGETASLAAPGASIEVVGATAVMLAEAGAQARVQEQLASAALAGAPASELGITILRTTAGAWDAQLAERGLSSRSLDGGAKVTVLSSSDLDALVGARSRDVTASATFRASHLQPFRLAGGAAGRSLVVDVLPVTGGTAGAAVEVASEWRPIGRAGAAVLRQRTTAGAPLTRGGGLALHGLTDPADASRDLVVVVRLGRALETTPDESGDAPLPPTRLSATEHLMPRSLARVYEVNAPLLRLPEHPIVSRSEALGAWLRRAAPDAASLEIRGGRVMVVGDDTTQAGVRGVIDNLARVRGAQSFRVDAFLLDSAAERRLIVETPSLAKVEGAAFASAVLPRARASALRLLMSTATPVHLTEPVVATPPTVRVDAAHVVRTPYRRDLDVAPGESTSWGRAETGFVDQGFLLAVRPFGRDARDRDDVQLSLRLVRVLELPARERRTSLGEVRLLEPHTEVTAGDLRVALRADDTLLLAALPSPFGPDPERRLVLLVRPQR